MVTIGLIIAATIASSASGPSWSPSIGLGPGAQVWSTGERVLVLAGPELAAGGQVRVGDDDASHHLEVRGQAQLPVIGSVSDVGVVVAPALPFLLATLSVGGGTRIWQRDGFSLRIGAEVGIGPFQRFSGDVIDLVTAVTPGVHSVMSWTIPEGYETRVRIVGRGTITDAAVTPSMAVLLELAVPMSLP